MKEAQIHNPNSLGHYHRDIKRVVGRKPYYVKIVMTCNHTKWISLANYGKYRNHATLCPTCSHIDSGYKFKEELKMTKPYVICISHENSLNRYALNRGYNFIPDSQWDRNINLSDIIQVDNQIAPYAHPDWAKGIEFVVLWTNYYDLKRLYTLWRR